MEGATRTAGPRVAAHCAGGLHSVPTLTRDPRAACSVQEEMQAHSQLASGGTGPQATWGQGCLSGLSRLRPGLGELAGSTEQGGREKGARRLGREESGREEREAAQGQDVGSTSSLDFWS